MKRIFILALITGLITSFNASAQQDKSKRPSPPAKVSQTLASGATISIDYSQPSVKGRSMDVLTPAGKVWRTGANEATIFETSKDVKVEGKTLPAGKYSVYSIPGEKEWTIIFNKTWNQWGTIYKAEEDVLRVNVKPGKAEKFTEMLTFDIEKDGDVSLNWANTEVEFKVQ
ncbi:DUF2911 domain-containing protein [Daejeonella lutea]|uniref:DUF2911 domain-containing protein n=1 Tax=Daejeonella lutea TaxID=572036 RepID=A0A1T5F660_9SPHI|nr:DUF2911 domain-containing protein [Daejeonella lutea]SKB91609.1 Protein of unknown function [Daejeonella lutea]